MEKRNTVQKQLVFEAVSHLKNHPTAEEVYAEVARDHPTVSKATVYRNLASLSEDGKLRHIPMAGGADRFDHFLQPHSHIACVECGALRDTPIQCDQTLDRMAEELTGYRDACHELVFYGVCPACAKKAGRMRRAM